MDAHGRFERLPDRLGIEDYNYGHFRPRQLGWEFKAILARRGIHPGEPAPDFMLSRVDGGQARLSELRDRPVLLHFGSFT